MDLKQYEQTKFAMAEILRPAQAVNTKDTALQSATRDLLTRLARYALRHDALWRHLTSEEKRRASQLLLLMLSGHRSLCAPWQVEFIGG